LKILLVRPPFYSIFGTERKAGNIPLGLCYIASALEEAGHNVEILDCETLDLDTRLDAGEMSYTHALNVSFKKYAEVMGNERHPIWDRIAGIINGKGADIVGFTSQTATMSSIIYISKMVQDSKIALGGVHATALPSLSLKETGADIVVMGEGERTIVDIANGVDIADIKGIAYREGSKIKINESRRRIDNLDSLPFPARHLLDLRLYKDTALGYIISSRGCPYSCYCCASNEIWGRQVRFRSPGNVIDEIEEVNQKYGTKKFRFTDDTFTLNRERVLNFCRELKERDLDISFRCGARTDRVDPELIKALKSAKCVNISYGVETGSQRILGNMGKQTTVENARRAVKMAKEAGLETLVFFIVGHPTETLDDIQGTTKLIEELQAHRTSVSIMTPYPGSQLFNPMIRREWWRYYHQGKTVKSLSTLSDERLNDVYSTISEWVKKMNLGLKAPRPTFQRS